MTAIVGILNRNGVAFASDSAATHSLSVDNKKKITNHANKLFELSKYHPVGVAICGRLDFMGIMWEDIFKLYRTHLEKASFPSIRDYVQDFMLYVRETVLPKFINEQKSQLELLCSELKKEIIDIAFSCAKELGAEPDTVSSKDLFPLMSNKLSEFIKTYSATGMRIDNDFDGYTFEDFEKYAQDAINGILGDICKDEFCPKSFQSLFSKAFFSILVSKVHVYLSPTEIVFWGFGENDFFPSCLSIKVSAAFDGRIKWSNEGAFSVSTSSSAWIVPFAQTDVSNTVVRGVDQLLRDKFSEKAKAVLESFKDDLVKKLDEVKAPDEFKEALSSLDIQPYADLYKTEMNQFIQENYISKMMDTVSFLMKEDLADMAESLVRMTCLKRHFTTDDETVGGPVDVAVATKGDGFVWIKRKHYFKADLNHHYFER